MRAPSNRTIQTQPIASPASASASASASALSATLKKGTPIGGYTIQRFVASGGFGSVYRATASDGKSVAIKVLHPELRELGDPMIRFAREADVLGRIAHPNVVKTFDSGVLGDGRAFIAMEFLDGIDLEESLERTGQLGLKRTLQILEPLCAALGSAHELGVVHRDVKASNVFLNTVDGNERVVLLDFGIAKIVDTGGVQLTSSRMALGTPTCIAPEQIRGSDIDPRTDVYALGALAFRMLAGKAPFEGSSHTMLHYMHLHSRRPSLRDVGNLGAAVDLVISRAMATQPRDRYATTQDFFDALLQASHENPTVRQLRRNPRERRDAIGVYVEIVVGDNEGAETDKTFDAIDGVLEAAQSCFSEQAFSPVFEGSNATLFASVMPQEDESALRRVRQTILAANEFYRMIDTSFGRRLSINVCVHRADVMMNGDEIRGGDLLRIDRWAPTDAVGVCFSSRLVADLELESEPVPGSQTLRRLSRVTPVADSDDSDDSTRRRHEQMMAQLGRQTASIVHDLRSPLTTVLAAIHEVLGGAGQTLCEDHREALEDALEAANQMRSMTQDILQVSSVGAYTSERRRVSVSELVDRAVGLTRSELRQKATVEVNHEDDGYFMGSLGRFTQVLTNLLINAAQAIDDVGKIYIRTQVTENGRVQIAVRDTGCGISEHEKPHIFEPYFTTKGVEEGTGLGLATVLETVKEFDGSVTVDSSPGAGTCFTISLPAAPTDYIGQEGAP